MWTITDIEEYLERKIVSYKCFLAGNILLDLILHMFEGKMNV